MLAIVVRGETLYELPGWTVSERASIRRPVLTFDAWPYGKKPVVVLSRTLSELTVPDGAVCEVMAGTPQEIVSRLGRRGMKHLYIDGGVTIQGFLEAGLIQRFIITRIPVLLGSGIPLFGFLSHDVRLEHVTTRSYPSGMVQSEYTIGPNPRVQLLRD